MENTNQDFLTVLLKYGMLFALIFAIIFLLAVLTPWMAKQVDKIIAKLKKDTPEVQEDPRCAQVKGLYDMPAEPSAATDADDPHDSEKQGEEL